MREPALSQRMRLLLALVDVVMLCFASWIAFDRVLPDGENKGFWFYTALLGLLLGRRLDTPFFVKPVDVVLYAAPAAISLALINSREKWDVGVCVAYCIAMAYCLLTGLLGALAILFVDSKTDRYQRVSNVARVLVETLGVPQAIYSVVVCFALYAFHGSSPTELGILGLAWVTLAFLSPIERAWKIGRRVWRILTPQIISIADGEIVAYQTPGIILIRQSRSSKIKYGDVVAVQDPLGHTRLTLALDKVGRDEGILLRTIEIPDAKVTEQLQYQLSAISPNAVARIPNPDEKITGNPFVKQKEMLVGLVAPDTSVERLFFEVVKEDGLEEGQLVEVKIGGHSVTYQLVNGITKEVVVQQKNTRGFAIAQAQKIGRWDDASKRFIFVKWLPEPNAPVLFKSTADFATSIDAIGHFPGTNYPLSIKRIDELVTHNSAILGILGVGKTMLAIELVERMMASGIKVICVDLTDQYATELKLYYPSARELSQRERLQKIGADGKTLVNKNVEEGGSRTEFANALKTVISEFVQPSEPTRLKVFNPNDFEVWRQDSKPYMNTASMASLSPAEITHIISEATINAVSALGMTDKARVCLVFEEAHSLVPEWNSTVADGDKTASNGCARAILQGRKYGLGCLLITQRTANVTKSILNQCNTIFAMRTFDDTGKEFLANYLGKDYAASLSSLSERQAVVFGKASSCENPVLIQLNDRDKFIQVFRTQYPPPPLASVSDTKAGQ